MKVKTKKHLVIAGDTRDMKRFSEKLIQIAKLDSRILFVGFVSGTILEELYSDCPFSVIESLIHGVPVLGANVGGILELLDKEGKRK